MPRYTVAAVLAVALCAPASGQDAGTDRPPQDLLDADWRARNRAARALATAERVDAAALLAIVADADGAAIAVEHPEDRTFGFGGRLDRGEDPVERLMMRPESLLIERFAWSFARQHRSIERSADLCVPWGSRELAVWALGERRVDDRAVIEALDAVQAQNQDDRLRLQAAMALVRIGAPARAVVDAAMRDWDRQDSMAVALARAGDAGHAVLFQLMGGNQPPLDVARLAARRAATLGLDPRWLRGHGDALARLVDRFLAGDVVDASVAGRKLLEVGATHVAPSLWRTFDAPNGPRCMRAVGLLASFGEAARDTAPRVVGILDAVPPPTAVWAAQAIASMRPTGATAERAVAALVKRWQVARMPAERLSILEALGRLGGALDDAAAAMILERVDADDLPTRLAAIRALGDAGRAGWGAFDRLAAIAADQDDPARADALRSLCTMGRRALPLLSRAVLEDGATDADEEEDPVEEPPQHDALGGPAAPGGATVPDWVETALRRQDPEVKRHLLLWLEHEDARLRRLALLGFGELPPFAGEFVPAILAALRDADPRVREAALEALPAYRAFADELLPAARRALDDPDRGVHRGAVDALIELDLDAARAAAAADLAHAATRRRAAALRVLIGAGPIDAEAERALLLALDDEDRLVRTTAIELLGAHARAAPAVVEGLQRFLPRTSRAPRQKETGDATAALLRIARRTE